MHKHLYHVFVGPRPEIREEAVGNVLDATTDWFRYAPGTYVVETSQSADELWELLDNSLELDGGVFICRFSDSDAIYGDIHRTNGRMPQRFWDWWMDKLKDHWSERADLKS